MVARVSWHLISPPLMLREFCLSGHPSPSLLCFSSPLPLPPTSSWTENKSRRHSDGSGCCVSLGGEGKGWAADKECFLKQKRKCWLGRGGKEAASSC